jgi:hypothetical protein
MIFHSLLLAFFTGIVIPGVLIFISPSSDIPWHDLTKGEYTNRAILYLSMLFVFFTLSFFFGRKGEIDFLKKVRRNSNNIFIATRCSFFLIVLLYLSRVIYLLVGGNISPYVNLALGVELSGDFFSKIASYFFFVLHKFYPLILGFIILAAPRKWIWLIFSFELVYGLLIFSKMIIVINIIAMTFIYFNYKDLSKYRYIILKIFFIGLSTMIIFFLLKDIFGFFRNEQVNLLIDAQFIKSALSNGYGRFQAITSVFYVDRVMSDFLYGQSLCHIVGNFVPDSLIDTPLSCRNIDESILIHFYSLSQNTSAVIDKDILTFFSEPYANFGLYGVLLFIILIAADKFFLKMLGDNKFGLLFAWVVMINIFIYHNSWSSIFGNIYISFIVIRVVQLLVYRFNKIKVFE